MSAQRKTFGQMAEEALQQIRTANKPDVIDTDKTATGLKRLEVAAQGLPITIGELSAFFADDLQSFGSGEVTQGGIVKAVRWYVFQHLGRHDPIPEPTPKEAGMVRCTNCGKATVHRDNGGCPHNVEWFGWDGRTPYRHSQSSPQWRWCSGYTARVHNLSDYRK